MLLTLPTEEQQVNIRKNFNEDVNTRDIYLKEIKFWLLKQPHLPDTWDDRRLMSFLRNCTFSLEACKKKLDVYFTVRNLIPEFFANRDASLPEFEEIFDLVDAAVLPDLTPDGKRVSIAKANRIDFETPNIANLIKLVFMAGDIRLEIEEVGVLHDVYVLDVGFSLVKHIFKVPPILLKKFFVCVQDAYPVRIKELHFINASASFELLMKVIQPFLNQNLRNSIHVHANIETLYEFVPKDILPEEYGGTAGKLTDFKNQWRKALVEYTPWFKEQENVKTDESKRPGKPITYLGYFGFDSTFSQLEVD